MKEYYAAFITSALSAIPPILVGERSLESPLIVFYILSVCFFLRGIILLLPYPLLGDTRQKFERAHPEAIGMSRPQREGLYRVWKRNTQKTEQGSGGNG